MATGCRTISHDGEILWFDFKAKVQPTVKELRPLVELRNSLDEMKCLIERRVDPFVAKAVVIETLIWSIFAYAAGSFIEYVFNRQDYHANVEQLIIYGLLAGAICLAVLLALILSLLWRSSRGHRIIIESAALLSISLPIAGIQAVSDLNRYCDTSETVVVNRMIARAETRVHRGRRGRRRSSYHLILMPAQGPQPIVTPAEIQVPWSLFKHAESGKKVELHLGQGLLGIPWYRRILI